MLLLFLVIYEIKFNAAIQVIIDNPKPSEIRSSALSAIKSIGGNGDRRLIDYYESAHSARTILNQQMVYEICNPEFYSSTGMHLLIDVIGKSKLNIDQLILQSYFVRNRWQLDTAIKSRLDSLVRDKYKKYWDRDIVNEQDIEVLEAWGRMCICRGIILDKSVVDVAKRFLDNKILIRDPSELANPPRGFPYPSRTCDFALLSILYFRQADILDIFNKHGLSEMPIRNYRQYNENMFDKVIKNLSKIESGLSIRINSRR